MMAEHQGAVGIYENDPSSGISMVGLSLYSLASIRAVIAVVVDFP
jgi:hypothetical protein